MSESDIARKGQRWLCLGTRETGKTYYADRLLDQLAVAKPNDRIVIWVKQPEAHYDGQEFTTLAAALEHPELDRWVLRGPSLVEVAHWIVRARELCPARGIIFGADEIADPEAHGTFEGWASADLAAIMRTVRGVSVVGTSQTPAELPPQIRWGLTRLYLFRMLGAGNLQRLRNDTVPDEVLEVLPNLADRTFIIHEMGR